MPHLATHVDGDTVQEIMRGGLAMVAHYERRGDAVAAQTAAEALDRIIAADKVADDADIERARVLAHGLAQCVTFAKQSVPAHTVRLLESVPADLFLGALSTTPQLLESTHWLCTLILRGGPNAMALAAASLPLVSPATLEAIRVPLMMAPDRTLIRIAEVHGLLTKMQQEECHAAQVLRSAFLARVWQKNDVHGLPWSRAYRGEFLVASVLHELGSMAIPMAKGILANLPNLLSGSPRLYDSVVRESISQCLAWVLRHEPDYVAPFRLAEAHIRNQIRCSGPESSQHAIRAYVMLLDETKQRLELVERGARSTKEMTDRCALLRDAYPNIFPRRPPTRSTLRSSSWNTPEETSVLRIEAPAKKPSRVGRTAAFLFLPFRFLAEAAMSWLGLCRHRSIGWTSDGDTEMTLSRKLFGWTLGSTSIRLQQQMSQCHANSIIGIHKTLGLWTALLIAGTTIGVYLMLSAATGVTEELAALGAMLIALGGFGYTGSLILSRAVSEGDAIIVDSESGFMKVQAVTLPPNVAH